MFSIVQQQTHKDAVPPLLSEGRYHGDATASVKFFGREVAQANVSLEVTLTRKPDDSNSFDADVHATKNSGYSSFFTVEHLNAKGVVTVDELKKQVTVTGAIPVLPISVFTKTVDVSKGSDGYVSGSSSLGQFYVSGKIVKDSTPADSTLTTGYNAHR